MRGPTQRTVKGAHRCAQQKEEDLDPKTLKEAWKKDALQRKGNLGPAIVKAAWGGISGRGRPGNESQARVGGGGARKDQITSGGNRGLSV